MTNRLVFLHLALFGCLWLFTPSANLHGADAPPSLTVRDQGTPLYGQQDLEIEPILRMAKGETLTPLAESVGQEVWYMVRTKQGQIGWVRAVDVSVSNQAKEAFREKQAAVANWAAVAEDGKAFAGSYTVEVWHEKLGKSTQKVTVKAKEDAKANFEVAGK